MPDKKDIGHGVEVGLINGVIDVAVLVVILSKKKSF